MKTQHHMYNKEEYERRIRKEGLENLGKSYFESNKNLEMKKRFLISNIINKLNPRGYILEIGCHLGAYSFLTCNKDRLSIGLDYVYDGLWIGKKYSGKYGKDVSFVQADAIKLPFKTGKINFITNIDFIEHIVYKKQMQMLREINRVLIPKGMTIVYTPNLIRTYLEYLVNKIKYFFRGRHYGWQEESPYKDRPGLKNHQDTKLHVGLLSFNKLKKIFLKNGFKVKKTYKIDYSPPFLTWFFKKFRIRFKPFRALFCSNSLMLFEKI